MFNSSDDYSVESGGKCDRVEKGGVAVVSVFACHVDGVGVVVEGKGTGIHQ